MKTFLLSLCLGLTLLVGTPAYAQDSAEEAQGKRGIKVQVDLDDDASSSDEQITALLDKVRKFTGDDIADELEIELKGMTPEEKKELVDGLEDGIRIDAGGLDGEEVVVAIVAIVFVFGMPIFILLLVFIFGFIKRRQKLNVMKAYLDSGKDVPDQVIAEFLGEEVNNFRSGIKLIAIGLGIIVAFAINDSNAAGFGFIPLFIGVARLVYWKFDKKSEV